VQVNPSPALTWVVQMIDSPPPQVPRRQRLSSQDRFIDWFQSVAPYIHAFRGKTFVIAFGGDVVADGRFFDLTHDLNLLAALGVRLVLVHGARPQIEAKLKERRHRARFHQGLRVTDEVALTCTKEASGRLRVEIEAALSMGLPNSPMAGADIRVASGNFIIAKPIGVVDGVDFMHTGEVRRIDAAAIHKRLEDNELVLLSPLGYSPSGEVFNLALEDVAAATAVALKAEKLIFLMDAIGVTGHRGELLRDLTVRQAQALLAKAETADTDARLYLPRAVRACENGVKRAHLISGHVDDGLLLELFTHKGVGTMLTPDPIETLRPARIEDIGGILGLIEPLEAEGIHKAGAQVTNKGGAGGTIGLAEFVSSSKGNDNAMMVMGAIMVGGILTNKSPVTLDQVVPLARLHAAQQYPSKVLSGKLRTPLLEVFGNRMFSLPFCASVSALVLGTRLEEMRSGTRGSEPS